MAFNINFSPVGTLVSLAAAAGQAQAAQRTQTLLAAQYQHQDDLRLRTQQLQQAASIQQGEASYRERAMQLQEAASRRIDATPTSYQQMKDRMAIDLENRMTLRKEASQERQDQQNRELEALDVYRNTGGMTETQYNTLRLGIMSDATGGSVMRALTAGDVAGTPAAIAKQKVILGKAVAAKKNYENLLIRPQGSNPTQRTLYENARNEIDKQMTTQYGSAWETLPNTPDIAALEDATRMPSDVGRSEPLPFDMSKLVNGKRYRLDSGELRYWNADTQRLDRDNPKPNPRP